MNQVRLINLVQNIVKEAEILKDIHTDQKRVAVNYACIFSQSENEFEELKNLANQLGPRIKETKTGPIFKVKIETCAGELNLLKIRAPDENRTEVGDADFTVNNFSKFKEQHQNQKYFSLIQRENFEMLELFIPKLPIRVYFSNPTQKQLLNI